MTGRVAVRVGGSVADMTAHWSVLDGRATWNGRTLVSWVGELVDEIVARIDPEQVWLYGSVARGDDDGNSDIDLLVVVTDLDGTDVLATKQDLLASISVPVPFDVAFTDPDRMARRAAVPGTLERAALREGRLVHGRG